MKEIDIEVELSTKDLYAFSMRHTYSNISGILGLLISAAGLVVCAVRFSHLDTKAIVTLIIIGLLFPVIQPLMLWVKANTQVKKNKDINGKLSYCFGDDGIRVSQGDNHVDVKWYELRKKVVTSKAMYLYMSPIRAFIFPANQCEGHFEELVQTVTQKMKEYKDYEPEYDENEPDSLGTEVEKQDE